MTSETLKCPSCGLNQFVNAAETCKRCKAPMKAVEAEPRPAGRPKSVLPPMRVETMALAAWLAIELKKRRLAQVNMSQRGLAERMGCARNYISKVENNSAQPGIPMLQRFAAALNTTAWQILKNAEEAMKG